MTLLTVNITGRKHPGVKRGGDGGARGDRPVRGQPQQSRATDRTGLRHARAARPGAAQRGARLRARSGSGDSLFSKPRYEPIALLSAISQRTTDAKLGTACIVTSPRNPLYLALEWATLDVLSGGRTIFGPCAGNPEKGVRREFEALGLDFDRRFDIFEEGLDILRQLWIEGTVTHHGEVYDYDGHRLLLGYRDGTPHAHPAAAALLDRLQPAPRDRCPRRDRWCAP